LSDFTSLYILHLLPSQIHLYVRGIAPKSFTVCKYQKHKSVLHRYRQECKKTGKELWNIGTFKAGRWWILKWNLIGVSLGLNIVIISTDHMYNQQFLT